jgi:ribosomal protein L24
MLKSKKASSVHVSNVGLYDPAVKKAVRVMIGYHPDTGETLRVSKKSGRIFYRSQALINKMKR